MIAVPETRYARSEFGNIAYQVVGDGPIDVVFVGDWMNHVEWNWELPRHARFLARLASFSRLIIFEQAGHRHVGPRPVGPAPHARAVDGRREDGHRRRRRGAGCTGRARRRRIDGDALRRDIPRTSLRARAPQLLFNHAEARRLSDRAPAVGRRCRPRVAVRRLGYGRHPRHTGTQWRRRSRASPVARSVPAPLGQPGGSGRDDPMGPEHRRAPRARRRASPDARPDASRRPVPTQRPRPVPRRAHPVGSFHRASRAGLLLLRRRQRRAPRRGPGVPDRRPRSDKTRSGARHRDVHGHRGVHRACRRARRPFVARHGRAPPHRRPPPARAVPGSGGRHRRRRILRHFDGPARAIRCAEAIRDAVQALGIDVRIGLHTGECELLGDKISGIAVNTGARVGAHAGAGEILVSRTVVDLVAGSGITFEDRGTHELKGIPGEWQLYAVET